MESHDEIPTFLEEKPCPICEDDDSSVVDEFPPEHYPHAEYETASWDGRQRIPLTIVRCASCSLVYSRPSFRVDHLNLIYPDDLVDDPPPLERLFRRGHPKHAPLARLVSRTMPVGARVVDLGSRFGVFPWILRESFGVDAYGIELNAASVAWGQERFDGIIQGSIEDLPAIAAEKSWDRIHAFTLDDVLEHLVNPRETLDALAGFQAPGDRLILRQMDVSGLGHRLYGEDWYYLQPAAHMYYFDEKTASALLDQCGYDVLEVVRVSALRNLVETLARDVSMRIRRTLRRRRPGERPLYLTQRKRAEDDMFMVVGQRRA